MNLFFVWMSSCSSTTVWPLLLYQRSSICTQVHLFLTSLLYSINLYPFISTLLSWLLWFYKRSVNVNPSTLLFNIVFTIILGFLSLILQGIRSFIITSIIYLLNLFFNWRKIAFQCYVSFCHTATWTNNNYVHILPPEPPSISLSHPSRSS